jgi:hypothetical protein
MLPPPSAARLPPHWGSIACLWIVVLVLLILLRFVDRHYLRHISPVRTQNISRQMRMTTPDSTKWMVTVCAKVFCKDQISRSEIAHLNDPSTGEKRQYVLVQNSSTGQMIVETQSLEADFSSFLVGRHVVKDGNLYVLSPVDPLFFVLRGNGVAEGKKPTSWQPFGQALEYLCHDKVVRDCVTESQLGHLCQTLCNDQTDNVAYFKFSDTKALTWLKSKQERVYLCLLNQEQEHQRRLQGLLANRPQGSNSKAGGSTSSTFYIPDDPMAAAPSATQTSKEGLISHQTLQKLKWESLQVVCNYLSEEWTTKLLDAMEVSLDQVFVPSQSTKVATTNYEAPKHSGAPIASTTTPAKITPKPKRVEPSRSVANKRLEKVNKRGMSSLTSFFGPPKKKQATSKG